MLIKDHHGPDQEGNFLIGPAVRANKLTPRLPKDWLLGDQNNPAADNNKADYMSKTMIQASDLKDQLENLRTTCNNSKSINKC